MTNRLVGARVDWLTLAFRGELVADEMQRIDDARITARALGTDVVVDIGEKMTATVSPRSRDGWYALAAGDVRVVVDTGAAGGYRVEVVAPGRAMMRWSARDAVDFARDFSRAIIRADDERVRRIDLAVDVAGVDVDALERDAWLTRTHTRVTRHAAIDDYGRAGRCTGYSIGRSSVRLRCYDKLAELATGKDDEKKAAEFAAWLASGWHEEPIARVEYQLRGDVLDELDVRKPDVTIGSLDAIWAYLTDNWCRYVNISTSPRRARCTVAPWWCTVQSAIFATDATPAANRRRRESVGSARLAFGCAANYAARIGAVREHRHPLTGRRTTAEEVAAWTDEYAARYVDASVRASMAAARRAIVDDLVRVRGAKAAAAYIVERTNAALDRASRRVRGPSDDA